MFPAGERLSPFTFYLRLTQLKPIMWLLSLNLNIRPKYWRSSGKAVTKFGYTLIQPWHHVRLFSHFSADYSGFTIATSFPLLLFKHLCVLLKIYRFAQFCGCKIRPKAWQPGSRWWWPFPNPSSTTASAFSQLLIFSLLEIPCTKKLSRWSRASLRHIKAQKILFQSETFQNGLFYPPFS